MPFTDEQVRAFNAHTEATKGSWKARTFGTTSGAVQGQERAVVGLESTKKGHEIASPEFWQKKPEKKRIRQSSKPLSNKLEAEWGMVLRKRYPNCPVFEQSITFRLCNGVRLTPDWVVYSKGYVLCFECKGFMRDDAAVKLKVAADKFPDFAWCLVWKQSGRWHEQRIIGDKT